MGFPEPQTCHPSRCGVGVHCSPILHQQDQAQLTPAEPRELEQPGLEPVPLWDVGINTLSPGIVKTNALREVECGELSGGGVEAHAGAHSQLGGPRLRGPGLGVGVPGYHPALWGRDGEVLCPAWPLRSQHCISFLPAGCCSRGRPARLALLTVSLQSYWCVPGRGSWVGRTEGKQRPVGQGLGSEG